MGFVLENFTPRNQFLDDLKRLAALFDVNPLLCTFVIMIRTILKSNKNSLTLELPDDLVGKMIEVIAFSVEDVKVIAKDTTPKEARVAALKDKLKKFAFNSGGYKFDRDEANDYE
jgi:hypothetical protein